MEGAFLWFISPSDFILYSQEWSKRPGANLTQAIVELLLCTVKYASSSLQTSSRASLTRRWYWSRGSFSALEKQKLARFTRFRKQKKVWEPQILFYILPCGTFYIFNLHTKTASWSTQIRIQKRQLVPFLLRWKNVIGLASIVRVYWFGVVLMFLLADT